MSFIRWLTAALAPLALCASALAADENLVGNGGFEKGLDGWTVNDESRTVKAEIDTKVRVAGKASAHVVKRESAGLSNDRLQFEIKRVPAGKTVVVSAKIKGKGLQNCWIKLFVYDAKGASILDDCDVGRFTGTFDWRGVEAKFDLPKEAVRAELRLCFFKAGEAWLDEVRVIGDAPAAVTKDDKRKPLEPELAAWFDANAVKVKSLDPKATFDDLAPLNEMLKGARIVQLGENTHGDGACFEGKARLVRLLHEEMGFEVLAFESGLFECDRANDLLRKGDADGAMKGSVFGIWHVSPVKAMFRYLAERANSEKPLLLAGFDCRRSGGLADGLADALAAFLAPVAKDAASDAAALRGLETLLEQQGDHYAPPAADLEAAQAAWTRLRTALDENRAKLVEKGGEAETEFFSHCLDNWRANEAFERSKSDRTLGEWGSSSLRDPQMAANLKWLADVRFPGKKIITWGATVHLSHGLTGVNTGGKSDFYKAYSNMGGAVDALFGKACFTIGFAAYGGQWGIRGARNPVPEPKEGSAEDLMHRYGAPFLFVGLRGAKPGPFGKPLRMAPMSYDRGMEAVWPGVLDAVFFIDEMTPAR